MLHMRSIVITASVTLMLATVSTARAEVTLAPHLRATR